MMARTASKDTTSKAMVNWEEELAKQAQVAADLEPDSCGSFFGTQGGILTFGNAQLPNNEVGVIILDAVFENVYFFKRFSPNEVQSPDCYAFSRDDQEGMVPFDKVEHPIHSTCKGCPNNEWGSSPTGEGKACRNVRRLAMIQAGTFDKQGRFEAYDTADMISGAPIGFMKIPVTSTRGYASFVKTTASVMKRPPYGIFTRVHLVPDSTTQFKVLFEPIEAIPVELMDAVMEQRQLAVDSIIFPYKKIEEEESPRGRRKAAAKPVNKPVRGARR